LGVSLGQASMRTSNGVICRVSKDFRTAVIGKTVLTLYPYRHLQLANGTEKVQFALKSGDTGYLLVRGVILLEINLSGTPYKIDEKHRD
jgi:hypothetical protein